MQWGVFAAAVVASGMLVLRMLLIGVSAFRALDLEPRELVPHAARGVFFSLLCLGATRAAQYGVGGLDLVIVNLFASGLLTLACLVGVVFWRPALLGSSSANMLVRFVPRLRRRLSSVITN